MHREIDCLIVGSGMGSVTCGTALAQRGWRVVLLTPGALEDSFYRIQDRFEHDRSPDLLWGLEEGGFLHPLLATEEQPPVVRLQPGGQGGMTPLFGDRAGAVAAACFGVDPSQATVAMAAMAFGHARKGFFAPRGGTKAFIERPLRRFQVLGGDVRDGVVREITV